MTTTTTAPEVAPPDELTTYGTSRARSGARRWAIAGVVVVLGAAGVFGSRALRSSGGSEYAQLFTVSARSFPVLLREKGELKAAESVDIKCRVEGRSTIIWLVEEGTEVQEGDLLVRLASDQIDERVRAEEIRFANAEAAAASAEKEHEILLDQNKSDLRKASLAVDLAKLEKRKYLEGEYKQTTLDIELEIKRAEKVLQRAESDLNNSKILYEQKFISLGDLRNDEIADLEARNAVEKAKLRKKTEENYTHPKMLRQKESDLSEAQKDYERVEKSNAAKAAKSAASLEAKKAEHKLTEQRLAKYREQQANCEIKAPQAGLVVYDTGHSRWDRRQITEGAEVHERQTIIRLPDPTVMIVTVRIHEAKTDRIKLGQEAHVEVEGVPGQIFAGKVTKIAVLADSQNMWLNPDLKEYETEITLNQSDPRLKPGVTARADIIVGQADNVLSIPTQAVFAKAGHHFVFSGTPTDAKPVEVQLGIASDEYVEVTSGVSAGEQILLAVSEELHRTLPNLKPIGPQVNGQPAAKVKQRPAGGKSPGQGRRGGSGHRGQGRKAG